MNKKSKAALLYDLLDSSSDDDFFTSSSSSSSSDSLLNTTSSDDSSSSSSSEEDDDQQEQSSNFMDIIDTYSETDFKSNFRLNRSTVEQLIAKYSQSEIYTTIKTEAKLKIEAKTEVTIYLWYISHTIEFRQLGFLFGIAESSAWTAIDRVSSWLISKGHEYIKWPQADAVSDTCKKFKDKKKLPGVIGAIHCLHIPIVAPTDNAKFYLNSQNNYSLVLQGVVDADEKFIDICCGEPGSMDVGAVLNKSSLYKRVQTNYLQLLPSNTFLLGDSTYPPSNWIVPPFKDNGQLTDQQRSFNNLHSGTWMVVESVFSQLKSRFRRLTKFTEQQDLNFVSNIVASTCILHNLCVINDDQYDVMDDGDKKTIISSNNDRRDNNENLEVSVNRRQLLFDYLCQRNII